MKDQERYIYCSNQANADAFQAAVLDMSYEKDDPKRPSRWFSETTKDGEDAVRVRVKTSDRFWIRTDASPYAFDALLQPYIDQGVMDPQELALLQARISLFGGTRLPLPVFATMPKTIRSMAWTHQDMVDNGWIVEGGE